MSELLLLLQVSLLGLLFGGVYALAGSGLTIVFGVMRIINIAHASFMILAAYFAFWLFALYRVDPILSIALSMPLFFLLGLAINRLILSKVAEAPVEITVVLTVGLALIVRNLMAFSWTSIPRSATPSYGGSSIQLAGLFIPVTRLMASLISVSVLAGLFVFLWKSKTGRAIRATILDRKAAQLVGVDVKKISAIAFGIGLATAGAAGAAISVIAGFRPSSDLQWIASLLSIVVLGGMQSLKGLVVAALILGVAESIATLVFSAYWSPMVFFVFLVGTLLIRPQGLFGEPLR